MMFNFRMGCSLFLLLTIVPLTAAELFFEGAHPGLPAAKKMLQEELSARPGEVLLVLDETLAADEYAVSWQGGKAVCRGGTPRGVVYGAMKLAQSPVTENGNFAGHPRWRNAFFCDQRGLLYPVDRLTHLVKNEVRGFIWNLSWHDWKALEPDKKLSPGFPEVKEQLKMIQKESELGLLDYAMMIRIANNNTNPSLNCASDEEIDRFIQVLKLAAQNGIKHILVCADDHTKFRDDRYVCTFPEEVKRFGDSVGRAHGYLCQRVWIALKAEFPELELTFCPAPYSLFDHNAENSANRTYFKDWAELAQPGWRVIWTGPKIIPEMAMSREHFERFAALVPGHKLMYFDNSECIDHPWPMWMARIYPDAAADHEGFMLENNHSVSWPDTMPFLVSGAEYLQKLPADADLEAAFIRAATGLYGESGAKIVLEVSHLVSEYRQLNSFFITRQPAILARLEELKSAMKAANITTERLDGWIGRMNQSVTLPRPEIAVPAVDSVSMKNPADAFFTAAKKVATLQNDGTESTFGDFYFAHDGKTLYIAFTGPVLEKITPEKASGKGWGICYDYIYVRIADEKTGPLDLRVNAVSEKSGEDWPFVAALDGKDCRFFIAVPFAELRKKGLTEFEKTGKLAVYAARVTYTVNHYAINIQRNPANFVLEGIVQSAPAE